MEVLKQILLKLVPMINKLINKVICTKAIKKAKNLWAILVSQGEITYKLKKV